MPQATPEASPRYGRVSLLGLGLWTAALLSWLALLWRWPAQAGAVALGGAAFLYSGKLGAITVGQAAGANPWLMAWLVWAVDVGGLLVFFPLTQVGIEALERRRNRVSRWLAKLTRGAQRHRSWIDRWGPAGLFAFSILPVYLNSPLVGAAVGRIAGLRPSRTLAALVSAITLMTTIWSVAAWLTLSHARAFDRRLAWGVGLVFAVPPLIALGVRRLLRKPKPTP